MMSRPLISCLSIPLLLASGAALADSGPAIPKQPPRFGTYLADGLVTGAATGCTVAVGTTYSGVLQLLGPTSTILREPVNEATGASIYEVELIGSKPWALTTAGTFTASGKYFYGTIGQGASTGTYTATLVTADSESFVLKLVLTYSVTSGSTTATCTESDQLTLLATS